MVRIFWLVWHFLTHRWTRYVAAWAAALGIAGWQQYLAQQAFHIRETDPAKLRSDGNEGHTSIDFGGQWLMGRMLTKGYGRYLYDRNHQLEVAQAGYPRERERPSATEHDAENLVINWFIDGQWNDDEAHAAGTRAREARAAAALPLAGSDALQAAVCLAAARELAWTPQRLEDVSRKRIAGPLYPPIHAFLMAPLTPDDDPQKAYFRLQWILMALAFVAGFGVSYMTQSRLWCPVAATLIMFYPGFQGAHALGQNPPLTLAILVWGWALAHRGYETAGGAVWGLLAYKPTWAIAFFLVPLLLRRWRMLLAMAAVGGGLALATLPVVGIDAWRDWMRVGGSATRIYDTDENWIFLGRDLMSLPRRFLLNFADDDRVRDRWYVDLACWALFVAVLEGLVRLSQLCRPLTPRARGPAAAFLLLGAWMMCFHFMYYDSLVSALGVIVLLYEPAKYVRPLPIVLRPAPGVPLTESLLEYLRPRLARSHPDLDAGGLPVTRGVWVANSFVLYLLLLLIAIQNWFPFFGVQLSAQLGQPPLTAAKKNGSFVTEERATLKTEGGVTRAELTTDYKWNTPMLTVTTFQRGPAWETWVLMGVWMWAGVCMVRQWLRDEPGGEPSKPLAASQAAQSSTASDFFR